MKEVTLPNTDLKAIVDDEDFGEISKHKWHLDGRTRNSGHIYAKGYIRIGDDIRKTGISMHRLIMGAGKGQVVDHINHNGLDNRKENLRICTQQQNTWNRKLPSDNTTGFIGVTYDKSKHKYVAGIRVNKRRKFLGLFEKPEDAAECYKKAALKYHGEFVPLNEVS